MKLKTLIWKKKILNVQLWNVFNSTLKFFQHFDKILQNSRKSKIYSHEMWIGIDILEQILHNEWIINLTIKGEDFNVILCVCQAVSQHCVLFSVTKHKVGFHHVEKVEIFHCGVTGWLSGDGASQAQRRAHQHSDITRIVRYKCDDIPFSTADAAQICGNANHLFSHLLVCHVLVGFCTNLKIESFFIFSFEIQPFFSFFSLAFLKFFYNIFSTFWEFFYFFN